MFFFFCKGEQVIVVADDIMVIGYRPDHSDHVLAFTSLLQTAQKCKVKFNFDKMQYKQNEIDFYGETYTTSGHKPERSKVLMMTTMPSPTNKKQVQLFIGMINYLSNFLPTLSELAEPIRELSKDKVPFDSGPEHQAAFQQRKRDANIKGLGSCLLQEEKPVYFASKALTEPLQGYVAIEIESLAVACAMENFDHFLYASHLIIETDQKPIEAIFSRSLDQATPRIQQILIRMFAYHFTVRYIPGVKTSLQNVCHG